LTILQLLPGRNHAQYSLQVIDTAFSVQQSDVRWCAFLQRVYIVHCPFLPAPCCTLQLLPGGDRARYELLADLGELLLAGEDSASPTCTTPPAAAAAVGDVEEQPLLLLARDAAAAAEAFNEAAEEAAAAFKGKLSQRYFERAAAAEAAAECSEEAVDGTA
jgi:hypothetical protein